MAVMIPVIASANQAPHQFRVLDHNKVDNISLFGAIRPQRAATRAKVFARL
jgi:hypothetical protein